MKTKVFGRIAAFFLAVGISMSNGMVCSALGTNEWHKKGETYYYIDEKGNRATGYTIIGDYRFYFDENGYALMGFQDRGYAVFYCDPAKRGAISYDWKTVDGKRYYFGKNGYMRTGWQEIDGKVYFFRKTGEMAVGDVTINGEKYEFDSDGSIIKGTPPKNPKFNYTDKWFEETDPKDRKLSKLYDSKKIEYTEYLYFWEKENNYHSARTPIGSVVSRSSIIGNSKYGRYVIEYDKNTKPTVTKDDYGYTAKYVFDGCNTEVSVLTTDSGLSIDSVIYALTLAGESNGVSFYVIDQDKSWITPDELNISVKGTQYEDLDLRAMIGIDDNNDLRVYIYFVGPNGTLYSVLYHSTNDTKRGLNETLKIAKSVIADFIFDFTY